VRPPFVAFDWDGVLHSATEFQLTFDQIDLAPVREALARGWTVGVMTANDLIEDIALALMRQGIRAFADHFGRCREGFPGSNLVVVSNYKLWADVFVDDRAVRYQFGESVPLLMGEVEVLLESQRLAKEAAR
jgi:hypothetical protein